MTLLQLVFGARFAPSEWVGNTAPRRTRETCNEGSRLVQQGR